ncbi:helix-turn-helix domain-containing protein [Mangrovibacterium marinum]|uniref:TolB-like protein n=1 Tax=Mangrovibacterium marinum TaxID=1639118 RepID=A0A2T5C4X4_9BACT|nr:helix-turn-helix domain-containing protein [Mangrovibacterium marinum]PTN09896.1 TolB-like protein [Mangrovibacterium marinum]
MVSKSTSDEAFTQRLTRLIEVNLKDEHFGVSELAKQMGMSRSNLYLKVHRASQKSVSCFIREVRLRKALEYLKEGERNVSQTAYEVGFGSPAYFSKCFHDYYGFPPGETPTNVNTPASLSDSPDLRPQTSGWRNRKLIGALVGIVIILAGLVIYSSKSSEQPVEKSIAVLPFKNLNRDQETQILADGIMEDILSRLSHIQDFTVKSSNSTEKYRDSKTTIPRIAKELNASYLLEGSILHEKDKIRLYVQLIDTKNDRQIWVDRYDRDLSGIFDFVTDVSRQIAEEMQALLSPREEEQMQKQYTSNTEAYSLYLKGIFFWKKRTVNDLVRSIDYFNQALAIDPDYALAYAGLANSYLALTFSRYYEKEKGFELGELYAKKALAGNADLAEAHVVLGSIAVWYLRDWKRGEKELLKTIELNPSYAVGHQYYSQLLALQGRLKEALVQINIAIQLDPNSANMYLLRANRYYHLSDFDQALINAQQVIEFTPNYLSAYWVIFRTYLHLGDDKNALKTLKVIFHLSDPSLNFNPQIDQSYAAGGMKAVVIRTIKQIDTNPKMMRFSPYYKYKLMAELYAIIGDNEQAINYLERHAESELFKPAWIKYGIEFKALQSDPRFIALINRMGLKDL